MTDGRFATTPEPPYFAVIFSSLRGDEDPAYARTATRMLALAAGQPGYLGVESVRDGDGFGITVSYWRDEASILHWKRHAEHAEARRRGRQVWYRHFELRVARVERAHAGPSEARD